MINRKVNNYIFLPVLFLIMFLQITFIPQAFSDLIVPNLILILLIAVSVSSESTDIFYVSFFCAFLLDIFSDLYFGPIIISVLIAVFISSYLAHYFLKKLFSLNLVLISFLGITAYNILYFVLINLDNFQQVYDLTELNRLAVIIIFEIIYTAIFIYPFAYGVGISIFDFKNKNENQVLYK
ncbi:MAG: hypothetical protein U9N04_04880 [Patescibacteria group bacterium]|nr:hypothetical protein [Patescibacteria group bacterium]